MTEQEQLENEDIEQNDNNEVQYLYMMFQYAVDSYYVGTVDSKQLNDGSYAFNILYPLAIHLDENNRYMFSELNNLGDSKYPLNLNKSMVLSIFSPNNIILEQYENVIKKLHNTPDLSEEFIEDDTTSADIFIYEVKKIQ